MSLPFLFSNLVVFGSMDHTLLERVHDKALFCGAKSMEDPQDKLDREALVFQVPNGKKLLEIVIMKTCLRR